MEELKEVTLIKSLYNLKLVKNSKTKESKISKTRKTSKETIVGLVSKNREWDTPEWAYIVPNNFTTALGITWCEILKPKVNFNGEKMKTKIGKIIYEIDEEKTGYYQSPFLEFSLGDVFYHKTEKRLLQIDYSQAIRYMEDKEMMYEGWIKFWEYSLIGDKWEKVNLNLPNQCSQIEFLKILITGERRF